MNIGYNKEQIIKLCDELERRYGDLGNEIGQNWPSLTTKLREEWVGPDEVAYEQQLASTLSSCYLDMHTLIQDAVNSIIAIGNDWVERQNTNYLVSEEKALYDISSYKVSGIPPKQIHQMQLIITVKEPIFTESTSFGLRTSTSAKTMIKAIEDFVDKTEKSINKLNASLNTSSAFFGKQVKKIDELINHVETILVRVINATNGIKQAINKLAASYTEMDSQVSTSITSAIKESK